MILKAGLSGGGAKGKITNIIKFDVLTTIADCADSGHVLLINSNMYTMTFSITFKAKQATAR